MGLTAARGAADPELDERLSQLMAWLALTFMDMEMRARLLSRATAWETLSGERGRCQVGYN